MCFRRMSARVDAVAARVQTAVTMKQVTGSMGTVVKSMEAAMRSMNLEKVSKGYWYPDWNNHPKTGYQDFSIHWHQVPVKQIWR